MVEVASICGTTERVNSDKLYCKYQKRIVKRNDLSQLRIDILINRGNRMEIVKWKFKITKCESEDFEVCQKIKPTRCATSSLLLRLKTKNKARNIF